MIIATGHPRVFQSRQVSVPSGPLLLATTNPGKVREIRRLLAELPVRLTALDEWDALPEPIEDGATFADNARIKARYYARATGQTAVGEDSGLLIDALGGRPGVQSARYPGPTYPDKFVNLYQELSPHPRPWTGRFVCSVALATPEGDVLYTCEGSVEGEIASAPRGSHGFGYDPIFFYRPYGRTFGETSDEEKLAVAHRGAAFRALAGWLCPSS